MSDSVRRELWIAGADMQPEPVHEQIISEAKIKLNRKKLLATSRK
jgi:hypothetical protein